MKQTLPQISDPGNKTAILSIRICYFLQQLYYTHNIFAIVMHNNAVFNNFVCHLI